MRPLSSLRANIQVERWNIKYDIALAAEKHCAIRTVKVAVNSKPTLRKQISVPMSKANDGGKRTIDTAITGPSITLDITKPMEKG